MVSTWLKRKWCRSGMPTNHCSYQLRNQSHRLANARHQKHSLTCTRSPGWAWAHCCSLLACCSVCKYLRNTVTASVYITADQCLSCFLRQSKKTTVFAGWTPGERVATVGYWSGRIINKRTREKRAVLCHQIFLPTTSARMLQSGSVMSMVLLIILRRRAWRCSGKGAGRCGRQTYWGGKGGDNRVCKATGSEVIVRQEEEGVG